MSFQAMAWAVEQKLPATKKIVLLMLANRVNSDTGKCVPKIKTLAEDCGLSETATKSAIKDLSDMGLLTIIPRFYEGQQMPNQYHLNAGGVGREATPPRREATQVGREATTEPGIEPGNESKHLLFDKFWKSYPKKIGKDAAKKAFDKRKPDDKLLGDMLKAIEVQKTTEDWRKSDGQFIPHPATWLNQGRWMDEVAGMTKAIGQTSFLGVI